MDVAFLVAVVWKGMRLDHQQSGSKPMTIELKDDAQGKFGVGGNWDEMHVCGDCRALVPCPYGGALHHITTQVVQ